MSWQYRNNGSRPPRAFWLSYSQLSDGSSYKLNGWNIDGFSSLLKLEKATNENAKQPFIFKDIMNTVTKAVNHLQPLHKDWFSAYNLHNNRKSFLLVQIPTDLESFTILKYHNWYFPKGYFKKDERKKLMLKMLNKAIEQRKKAMETVKSLNDNHRPKARNLKTSKPISKPENQNNHAQLLFNFN